MTSKKLSILIKISVLSAMGIVLSLFEIQIPIFPNFLKLDLSDIPALLGSFALGPFAGVGIELIKNAIHIPLKGASTLGIGELANFIVGSTLVFTAGNLYKHNKSRKNALISIIAGVLAMSIVGSITNYYIFLPLYESALGFKITDIVASGHSVNSLVKDLNSFIAYCILPFNLLKGFAVGIITFISYKKLSPVLHK